MKKVFYPASERGYVDHGWLKAFHSFSFGSYFNPKKVNFGALRVFNDDTIAGGFGFGKHPHDNMEIITIPLEGRLKHKDSTGNEGVIEKGEVQVMSAGLGIEHSEANADKSELLKLFQIWIFPDKKNVSPRYDQLDYTDKIRPNEFTLLVSPNGENETLWIHQNAWISVAGFDSGLERKYSIKGGDNGVYIMLIDGEIEVEDQLFEKRDAIGIWDTDSVDIRANKKSDILVLDIPMEVPGFVQ
ncbi:MAG: pirin family protein [Bergeyella sp.]|nr:pirin family protein [Bergeyella sp.]